MENGSRSLRKSCKSHGIWWAQKSTNPLETSFCQFIQILFMCSINCDHDLTIACSFHLRFSDVGTPVTVDSAGVVRVLSRSFGTAIWSPVCITKSNVSSDTLWYGTERINFMHLNADFKHRKIFQPRKFVPSKRQVIKRESGWYTNIFFPSRLCQSQFQAPWRWWGKSMENRVGVGERRRNGACKHHFQFVFLVNQSHDWLIVTFHFNTYLNPLASRAQTCRACETLYPPAPHLLTLWNLTFWHEKRFFRK